MLYIKRRSLRHVNLPGGRCYQRACLSGQGQANTTHLPVSPSVTGKNDPGIGGRSQCEAGGRQGEAETVTVHAQCFQEDLSPGRTPAAGGDMNAVHQRLYPCLRMSSAASSWMTFSLSCVRARCSISEVAEPRGKCSARIWRARSDPTSCVSARRRALSLGEEFSAHSSSGPRVNFRIRASVRFYTEHSQYRDTAAVRCGPFRHFQEARSVTSGTPKLSRRNGIRQGGNAAATGCWRI